LKGKEFRKALQHTGYAVSEAECDRLFYLVDTDHSGRISEQGSTFAFLFLSRRPLLMS